MRRLLVLVPALATLIALAPTAHANTLPASETHTCTPQLIRADPNYVTASVTWTDTADPDSHLLTGFTVASSCTKFWVQMWFRNSRTAPGSFHVWVQPGAVHSLGQTELQALGGYQRPFFKWSIHTGTEGSYVVRAGDCNTAQGAAGFLLTDGSIVACP